MVDKSVTRCCSRERLTWARRTVASTIGLVGLPTRSLSGSTPVLITLECSTCRDRNSELCSGAALRNAQKTAVFLRRLGRQLDEQFTQALMSARHEGQ